MAGRHGGPAQGPHLHSTGCDGAPRLYGGRTLRAPLHARVPRNDARDRRQSARAFLGRPAASGFGGPAPGDRSRPVQPRRHARLGQDRTAGLRRAVFAAGRFESGACGASARVAGARGVAATLRAAPVMNAVDQSYAYCRRVARSRAKNFYYSFLLLSRQQRKAMCAVYAFMRYCDDLSDEPGASREPLERWRTALDHALAGQYDGHPTLPAFHDTVQRYRIPRQYFHEMIDGVSSDLQPRRIQTFDELYRYCYQVASVVGLTIIHIFGFDSPAALPLAEKCGVAFQLTNILRDVREDLERGRMYLPAEDLRRFGLTEEDLRSGKRTPEFIELMRFEAGRARAYYQ